MDFWYYGTTQLQNKHEVFYGNDFSKKKQDMQGSNVLRHPWLSVKWIEMNFEESFLSSGYCLSD